jgi:hypothetical protein
MGQLRDRMEQDLKLKGLSPRERQPSRILTGPANHCEVWVHARRDSNPLAQAPSPLVAYANRPRRALQNPMHLTPIFKN